MLYVQLTLVMDALPAPINNERYVCEFGSSMSSSMATYDNNRLICAARLPDRAAFNLQGVQNCTHLIS